MNNLNDKIMTSIKYELSLSIPKMGGKKEIKYSGLTADELLAFVEYYKVVYKDDTRIVGDLQKVYDSGGFLGISQGGYSVSISAYVQRIPTTEFMRYPRRDESFMGETTVENPDHWDKIGNDLVCSYCGSLHPRRVLELLKENPMVLEPSTKSYKLYLHRPEIKNASFGGIKYYRMHDIHEENFTEKLQEICRK